MSNFFMRHEQNGNATVVSISGKVDSATAGAMDMELEKLISANKWVVLDFKNIEFLSSAGVRALVKATKTAKKAGHKVRLAAIPDHIADVMKTLGLMEIMQVYPSVEEALVSF
jgi:anti-sigma B factor antagonist